MLCIGVAGRTRFVFLVFLKRLGIFCAAMSADDLATLANLDEGVLLRELKERYQEDKIYVRQYVYLRCIM